MAFVITEIARASDQSAGASTLTTAAFSPTAADATLLVALVEADATFTAANRVHDSGSANWTAAFTDPVDFIQAGIYYKLVPTQSETSLTLVLTGNGRMRITVFKVTGGTSWALDVTNSQNYSADDFPTTAITAAIAATARVAFGLIGEQQSGTYSAAINKGTATPTITSTFDNGTQLIMAELSAVVDGLSGTIGFGVTNTQTTHNSGGVATFKGAAAGAAVTGNLVTYGYGPN